MTSTASRSGAHPKVFLIGATGAVGTRLISHLTGEGYDVTGLHRSSDAAEQLRADGATPVQGDIATDSVEAFAALMADHHAVVFCAGAGGDVEQLESIDGRGPGKAAEAAVQAGISRFVLVSVFMDAWRGDESPGPDFERYIQAKRTADVTLAATDLDWLIVRPGTLSDRSGTGSVNAGPAVAYDEIARDDLAAFIAAALFAPALNRVVIELTGGSTPVEDAVVSLTPRPNVSSSAV